MIRACRLVRQHVSVAHRLDPKRGDLVISLADRLNMCRRWNSSPLRMGYLFGDMTACEACAAPKAPIVRLKLVMPDVTMFEYVCAHRAVLLSKSLDTVGPLLI
jgi:hypothetical protein